MHPGNHVTLERLGFEGVVYRGPGAYWEGLIVGAPVPGGLHHVTIRQCRLVGPEVHASDRRGFWPEIAHARGAYRLTLALAEGHHHRVLDNDIVGPVSGGSVYDPLRRSEWAGNVIHGGGSGDMVSLNLLMEESLVDANRLVDAPGRFLVNSPWHTVIRYNEVKDMWRGSWANAEETYLQHGGWNDGADWEPKTLGTASAATDTTLTDARRRWKANAYRGGCVLITAGRGFGQWRRVTANDAATLTLASPWRVVPDATSEYCVEKLFFVENTYFANVNDTPGRLSLWLDCIGCLVDSHRDVFSGGLDVWGSENTSPRSVEHRRGKPNCYPSFYNHFARCWLDGAPAWFYCEVHKDATLRGPMLFACRMTECMANRAHAARTGFPMQRDYSGAVSVGGHVPRESAAPQSEYVGLSHTIVANNSLSWTPVGVTVSQFARKTFVVGNTFEGVEQPLLDWGLRTFFLGNTRQLLDPQGHRQKPLADVRSEREARRRRKPLSLSKQAMRSIRRNLVSAGAAYPVAPSLWILFARDVAARVVRDGAAAVDLEHCRAGGDVHAATRRRLVLRDAAVVVQDQRGALVVLDTTSTAFPGRIERHGAVPVHRECPMPIVDAAGTVGCVAHHFAVTVHDKRAAVVIDSAPAPGIGHVFTEFTVVLHRDFAVVEHAAAIKAAVVADNGAVVLQR